MKLSVIIPVFNEADTITTVVNRVKTIPIEYEIIIVNDASSDGTAEIADKLASDTTKVIHHSVNSGKGAAIRAGFQAATGDIVVVQDADLEYDPRDFVSLIKPITENRTDVVYGIRSLESQKLIMMMGNRFLTFLTNLIYNADVKDMETCYKMMKRDIALGLDLESRRFDVEVEITAKLLRAGHPIYELPISYTARYENKKLSPLDGFPALRALWKYRKWSPHL